MEKMPYRAELDLMPVPAAAGLPPAATALTRSDWRQGLPMLSGQQVVMRELRPADAPSLFALLTTEEVSRFISPPPTTVDGFERFIAWAQRQRAAGSYVCFAVTLRGCDTAIGIFQVRDLGRGFASAEWGFAIGSPFWGTGVFVDAAKQVIAFAFETLGVRRLEARAAVLNGRGNAALRKVGAVAECMLRKSFQHRGGYLDQMLYAIVDVDWYGIGSRNNARPRVH
jgi:RimJ/RimL family protein N-acetyltransferase